MSSARGPSVSLYSESFRPGSSLSSYFRTQLFNKTDGLVNEDATSGGMLLRCSSPISGASLLIRPTTAQQQSHVRDPISGATLRIEGRTAKLSLPVHKQPSFRSRTLYLRSDVENTINVLRNTNKVSRMTNEKIGTAGTPTGRNDPLFNAV